MLACTALLEGMFFRDRDRLASRKGFLCRFEDFWSLFPVCFHKIDDVINHHFTRCIFKRCDCEREINLITDGGIFITQGNFGDGDFYVGVVAHQPQCAGMPVFEQGAQLVGDDPIHLFAGICFLPA